MTNQEFKLEFNTYYNNVTSNKAPGYNDFEISQILTLAEEQIVAELYENAYSGFEKTENVRKSLDALLREKSFTPTPDNDNIFPTDAYNVDISDKDDVMYIVMEWAKLRKDFATTGKTVEVIPIKYDDFLRTYKNPFRGVSKKRVIRLDTENNKVKLHAKSGYNIDEYHIEYIKKPDPIIIGNSDFATLTINGKPCGTDVPCELDSSVHRAILLRAVQLAKAAWQSK